MDLCALCLCFWKKSRTKHDGWHLTSHVTLASHGELKILRGKGGSSKPVKSNWLTLPQKFPNLYMALFVAVCVCRLRAARIITEPESLFSDGLPEPTICLVCVQVRPGLLPHMVIHLNIHINLWNLWLIKGSLLSGLIGACISSILYETYMLHKKETEWYSDDWILFVFFCFINYKQSLHLSGFTCLLKRILVV